MKIISKEVKECEFTDSKKTKVLDIKYTHRGETGRILIQDYDSALEDEYIKELRVKVRDAYKNFQVKKAHNKTRERA
jgi:hypothetical protein